MYSRRILKKYERQKKECSRAVGGRRTIVKGNSIETLQQN